MSERKLYCVSINECLAMQTLRVHESYLYDWVKAIVISLANEVVYAEEVDIECNVIDKIEDVGCFEDECFYNNVVFTSNTLDCLICRNENEDDVGEDTRLLQDIIDIIFRGSRYMIRLSYE